MNFDDILAYMLENNTKTIKINNDRTAVTVTETDGAVVTFGINLDGSKR